MDCVGEGDHGYMDYSLINGLRRVIEPQLGELSVDLFIHPHYIAKWDWDLNRKQLVK